MTKLERLKQVTEHTGLSKSSLYRLIAEGQFPKPVSLGSSGTGQNRRNTCVGWVSDEVEAWVQEKIRASRGSQPMDKRAA